MRRATPCCRCMAVQSGQRLTCAGSGTFDDRRVRRPKRRLGRRGHRPAPYRRAASGGSRRRRMGEFPIAARSTYSGSPASTGLGGGVRRSARGKARRTIKPGHRFGRIHRDDIARPGPPPCDRTGRRGARAEPGGRRAGARARWWPRRRDCWGVAPPPAVPFEQAAAR